MYRTVIILGVLFAPFLHSISPVRHRRSVVQMCGMMYCSTGRKCIDYNYYGCYCGRGGAGTPVDPIDRCCFEHDQCYNAISSSESECSTYFGWYHWDCVKGTPMCTEPDNTTCHHQVCECDRTFSLCLKTKPYPLHKANCKISQLMNNDLQITTTTTTSTTTPPPCTPCGEKTWFNLGFTKSLDCIWCRMWSTCC